MVHRPLITGPGKYGPHTVGPMMHPDPPMILFVPDVFGQPFTDPSYHLPAFYELWSRWGPEEDRAFWDRIQKFFASQGIDKYGPVFTPDGKDLGATPG
jgi:oligosaccharide reducing-end xylanase